MIILYGNDVSTPSNKVRYVANVMELPYEYKRLNLLADENKTEDFLKMNPVGKVPTLQDGDFFLAESNAIIRYLADKESSNLYPKDLRRRGVVDQWIDFASLHIGAAVSRVFVNRVAYKFFNMELDERSLKDGLSFLDRFLPVLETQLKKSEFIAGPEVTLADFCLLAHLDPADVSSIDLSAYPNLKKWRSGLQAKPFYKKCFPSYGQMLQEIAAKMGK